MAINSGSATVRPETISVLRGQVIGNWSRGLPVYIPGRFLEVHNEMGYGNSGCGLHGSEGQR